MKSKQDYANEDYDFYRVEAEAHRNAVEEDLKIGIDIAKRRNFWWVDRKIAIASSIGKNVVMDEGGRPPRPRKFEYTGLDKEVLDRLAMNSREDIATIFSLSVSTLREIRATRMFLRVVYAIALSSLALNGWLVYELVL